MSDKQLPLACTALALAPLCYCVEYAINLDKPLAKSVEKFFLPFTGTGGDPGWYLSADEVENGVLYHAWTDLEISLLNPHEGYYSFEVVKNVFLQRLTEIAIAYPERRPEVAALISQYALE